MSYVPLAYAPDQDTAWDTMPGGCQLMRNLIPTRRRTYATWACQNTIAEYTSSTEPQIGYIMRQAAGTARFFLCNKQSIYEFTSTSAATDRSSGAYSASTETWTMAQFGDATIATNLLNNVQVSSSGAFADLSGTPPKAQLVVVARGQAMLLNYNDGTAYPDGWATSDLEDITDWTVTATNFADRGRLYDTPGPIRAAVVLRDTVVAFKDDSIYVGEFVGDPTSTIWAWTLVSDKVGCSSPHGVCVFNDKLYFVHRSGFYVFDGAQARNFGTEVTNAIFTRASALGGGINFTRIQTTVDHADGVIFFAFADSNRKLAATFPYNAETNTWGGSIEDNALTIEGVAEYATCVVRCTQSDIIAFDSTASTSNPRTVVYAGVGNTGKIGGYSGAFPALGSWATSPTFTTGPIGGGMISRVTELELAFRSLTTTTGSPTVAVVGTKSRAAAYDSAPTVAGAWNSTEYKYNISGAGTSSKFMVAKFTFLDSTEISGMFHPLRPAGKS